MSWNGSRIGSLVTDVGLPGVSSFGLGGTNAHVLIEEFESPEHRVSYPRARWQMVPMSAASETALKSSRGNLAGYLKAQGSGLDLGDVAYTMAKGRQCLRQRLCVVADSTTTAAARLENPDQLFAVSGKAGRAERPVVFLFSGQGTQYPGMALGLYRESSVFRENMKLCARIVGPIGGRDSLLDIVYGNDEASEAMATQTAVAQPLLFAVEYSLARLLGSHGIRPVAVVGHSSGELVAACEAGVFSLEEALMLVRERGRFMQSMEPGTMVAVPLPEAELRKVLPPALDVAVINAPMISEVSGPTDEVEDFVMTLKMRGISCRSLHTSHAFHSRMMEKASVAFADLVGKVSRDAPQIPLGSNFTGTWMSDEDSIDPTYWSRHLRNMVRFADNLLAVAKRFESAILLEVGPGNTLCSIARQQPESVSSLPLVSCVRHPRQQVPDEAFFLRTIGSLWCHGAAIDLGHLSSTENRACIPLPPYPFERQQLCIVPAMHKTGESRGRNVSQSPHRRMPQPARAGSKRAEKEHHPLSVEGLTEVWRDLLGIPAIRPDDNFFDLGGHSILAAQMFARIKDRYGINQPVSALLDSPTVSQLYQRLAQAKEHEWRALVPIASIGHRTPVFLVHGAEGNVLLYRDLASRMQPDQPVFGLQCKGLDGRGGHHTRIEAMAEDYIAEIEAAYPRGPLILGGYCMGGMVALDMAQRLKQRGRAIPLIMMLESYNYRGCGVHVTPLLTVRHAIQNLWFHLSNLAVASGRDGGAFLGKKARIEISRGWTALQVGISSLAARLHVSLGAELPHLRLSKVNDAAYFEYQPSDFAGAIAVFRPKNQFAGDDTPDCGWGSIAKGKLEIHVVPSNPRGMLVEPFVDDLARLMRESIARATAMAFDDPPHGGNQ